MRIWEKPATHGESYASARGGENGRRLGATATG